MVIDIPVLIPWSNDNNIGKAYNESMKSITDWALLLDHDIFMLNPDWYHILCAVAERLGHQAGWICGRTNNTFCGTQLDRTAPKNHDLMAHLKHAKKCHLLHGTHPVQWTSGTPLSGYMILTHRKAWEDVGGFKDGLLGVDNTYHMDLRKKGYKAYVLPGLYLYHMHKSKADWHKF